MASDEFQDSALMTALHRRKELQDTIKKAVQELQRLEEWLNMHRDLASGNIDLVKGEEEPTPRLRTDSVKDAQSLFETLTLQVLREVGRPMKSPEIVQEFKKRGYPLGGNEIRTAWNRLWTAGAKGVLTNEPGLGYWIASEPLSEEAKEKAKLASKARPKSGVSKIILAARGTKKGRDPIWTHEQVEAAERMLLAGKSRAEVAAALGGVSMGTLQKYVSISGLKAKYPDVVIPKRPRRPSRTKRTGRPRVLTADKVEQITKMKAEGKSVTEITDALGLKQSTVYRFLQQLKASESGVSQIRTPEDSN